MSRGKRHQTQPNVPYGPPQPKDSVPAARRGSAGRTALKVGVGLALPFVARALFRALTK
jgi:hypothetical protein